MMNDNGEELGTVLYCSYAVQYLFQTCANDRKLDTRAETMENTADGFKRECELFLPKTRRPRQRSGGSVLSRYLDDEIFKGPPISSTRTNAFLESVIKGRRSISTTCVTHRNLA